MADAPAIHLYDPDGDLPAIACREHDYDPGWDYDPTEPPTGGDLALVRKVADETAREMLPTLRIGAAVLFFVEKGGLDGAMARYVDGTPSCPVIGLDLETIRDGEACGLWFEDELRATVAHELGHAFVDARADRGTIDEAEEEAAVEDFADDWARFRIVNTGLLEAFVEACAPSEPRA